MENQDYNLTAEQDVAAFDTATIGITNTYEPDPKDKEQDDETEYTEDEVEYADGEGTLLNEEFNEEDEDEEQ
ncbi:hypothetical protein [Pedobacter jejuensis]|uniref:Uncharacterized protein n=1 Tax=Pedobacter jejuensis TaxID=1268550 RepID=A0A3N0BR33_9SPHI|nr:hypothetical protein [Pedobacter jejuensis]RNL51082.1 hypothetical protein D7004_15270 [Pedobacter jejuensis]